MILPIINFTNHQTKNELYTKNIDFIKPTGKQFLINQGKNDCFISFGNHLNNDLNLFKKSFYHRYGKVNIGEVLLKAMNEKNFLGKGRHSICYKIPGIRNYVFKLPIKSNLTPDTAFNHPIIGVADEFEGKNFGQKIARIKDIEILKKVEGTSHSLPSWPDYFFKKKEIKQEQAESFLNDLTAISKFSQKSYDDFAELLVYLNAKGIKNDSLNPNNLLIDFKRERIQMVDIEKDELIRDLRNSHYDMISNLLDMGLFKDMYNLLDIKQRKELLQTAELIINKCNKTKNIFKNDGTDYFKFLSYYDEKLASVSKILSGVDNLDNNTTRYKNMMQIINSGA